MTIIRGGKRYEDISTWPTTTKVLNINAFYPADSRFRGSGALTRRNVNPAERGHPQITWFQGTYDIPAHTGQHPGICRWRNIASPRSGGRATCIQPGQLSAQESEKWNKQWRLDADNIERAKQDKPPCFITTVDGKTRNVYTLYEGSYPSLHDCQTDAKIKDLQANVVRGIDGLGATKAEDEAIATLTSSYRKTELALVGALAVGLLVVMKR